MSIIYMNADFEDVATQMIFGYDEALIFLGKNEKSILNNYANPSSNITKTGTITHDNGATLLFKSDYLKTDVVLDTADVTVLSIFKQEVKGVSFLASSYVYGENGGGFCLTVRDTGNIGFYGTSLYSGGSTLAAAYTPCTLGEYNLVCGQIDAENMRTSIKDLRTGIESVEQKTASVPQPTSHVIDIGTSTHSLTGTNSNAVPVVNFMTVVFPKVLTADEIDDVAGKMRLYAAKYGIVV